MSKLIEVVVDVVFWIVGAVDVRSPDPVIAAQKRALLTCVASSMCAAVLSGLAVWILPAAEVDPSAVSVVSDDVRQTFGGAVLVVGGAAWLYGIGSFVRFLLILKWPERLVGPTD